MARVRRCLYRMPALRQAQGERKEGWSRGGPIDPSTGSGRTERGFAPWRAHRPFDRLRTNGKRVRAREAPSTLRQAQGERKEGLRRGGPIDPLTGSGRTEKRVGAVEGPSTLRQAQGERKEGSRQGGPIDPSTGSGRTERGFAPWRALRPFDRLRANGKRVRVVEGPSTLRQAQGEREEWRPCEISDCIASFGIASPGVPIVHPFEGLLENRHERGVLTRWQP